MLRSKWRWLFLLFIIILAMALLLSVRSILSPFLAAYVLAYLLSPLVEKLKQMGLGDKGAIVAVVFAIFVLFGLIIFLLLPIVYQELMKIMLAMPGTVKMLEEQLQGLQANFRNSGLPSQVADIVDGHISQAAESATEKMRIFMSQLPELLASVGLLVLSPVIAIYLLADWNALHDGLLRIVPRRWRMDWQRLLQDINHVVRSFLRGNLIVAVIVGMLSGIGIKLLGLDYALLIGVICGVFDLIPYFGPLIGAVPAILLGLMQSPLMALKVGIVLIIVQQLESNVIAPKLMGDSVGLHPLWIIFALLAGGEIAGVWGMLFAVPIAAVTRVIIRHIFFCLVSPRLEQES